MYVRMLDGPFAGELRNLRSDVALEFIRDKRAARAFEDTAPAAPAIAAAASDSSPGEPKPGKAAKQRKAGR